MEIYICPMCKAQNEEYRKYCSECGTWLQSTTFPAQKLNTVKKKRKTIISRVVPIIIFALIGIAILNSLSKEPKATFGDIQIGDAYTISQLHVNQKVPSATADFTVHSITNSPLEITASFYDDSGKRLGVADSLIGQQLAKDQTVTVNFTFTEPLDSGRIKNVRINIASLSPMMLIDRMADKASKLENNKK